MAKPPNQPTSNQIRNLRRKLGLTQEEFALLFGMRGSGGKTTICRWEHGTQLPCRHHSDRFWEIVRQHGLSAKDLSP